MITNLAVIIADSEKGMKLNDCILLLSLVLQSAWIYMMSLSLLKDGFVHIAVIMHLPAKLFQPRVVSGDFFFKCQLQILMVVSFAGSF